MGQITKDSLTENFKHFKVNDLLKDFLLKMPSDQKKLVMSVSWLFL